MCNDPKCPLNRQGVPHEDHESIENKPVTNPCLDGRCGLNRMGIPHESHDSKDSAKTNQNQAKERFNSEPNSNFNNPKQNRREHNRLSREEVMQERERRERQKIQQEAQEEANRRERQEKPQKQNEKQGMFSRFKIKHGIPSPNQILHSHDPYIIFGLSNDTTCQEIKQKFKELSRAYNASTGSMNKTVQEKETLNRLQSRINVAYDFLRERHCT